MNYSWALKKLNGKHLLQRSGWNAKGMFIFLVPGSVFKVTRPPLLGIFDRDTIINYQAHIDMFTADKKVVPWLCSQSDALADDWKLAVTNQ